MAPNRSKCVQSSVSLVFVLPNSLQFFICDWQSIFQLHYMFSLCYIDKFELLLSVLYLH